MARILDQISKQYAPTKSIYVGVYYALPDKSICQYALRMKCNKPFNPLCCKSTDNEYNQITILSIEGIHNPAHKITSWDPLTIQGSLLFSNIKDRNCGCHFFITDGKVIPCGNENLELLPFFA